jgi:hypothetical protein
MDWALQFDESTEMEDDLSELKKEEDRLAILRADYQWIVVCQNMHLAELKQEIDRGPFPSDEAYNLSEQEHYLKRYHQALIVYESRTREPTMDGLMTIREITNDTGVDRSILLKCAQHKVFKGRTHQSGATWLVDVQHASFQEWKQKHIQKGSKKLKKNIGQQVIINPDQTRFVKSIYSDDEQSGFVILDGKRAKAERVGWVDDRQLKQTWRLNK